MTLPSILLILAAIAFYLGRARSFAVAGGDARRLHSRPGHDGWWVVLLAVLPPFALWCAWRVLDDWVFRQIVQSRLSDEILERSPAMLAFYFHDVRRIAAGQDPVSEASPAMRSAGAFYAQLQTYGDILLLMLAAVLLLAGFVWAYGRIAPDFRGPFPGRGVRGLDAAARRRNLDPHHRRDRLLGALRIHPVL